MVYLFVDSILRLPGRRVKENDGVLTQIPSINDALELCNIMHNIEHEATNKQKWSKRMSKLMICNILSYTSFIHEGRLKMKSLCKSTHHMSY